MTSSPLAKRALDLSLAVPALVISLPIQAIVAIGVRRRLGKPILFRQLRPGLHGKPFELIKFRTMLIPDAERGLLTDEQRLVPFGAWLRATSLDELPTLWNIVRGDMSLVGPRPLLMQYLDRYSPEQARRHDVKPGLTGLAQVAGRNSVDWDDRLTLDVAYVSAHTILGDITLILRTILPVLSRRGVSGEGSPTMVEFRGPTGASV